MFKSVAASFGRAFMAHSWVKVATIVGALIGVPLVYKTAPKATDMAVSAAESVGISGTEHIKPEDAPKNTDKEVVVEFVAAGGIRLADSEVVLINSKAQYKAADCLTVALTGPAYEANKSLDKKNIKGKKVRVTGKPTTKEGRTQISVEDPTKISVK